MAVLITGLPVPSKPSVRDLLGPWYALCLAGKEPAELLGGEARKLLVQSLWRLGWTDLEIAVHTKWTEHVVARIRGYLELGPNR